MNESRETRKRNMKNMVLGLVGVALVLSLVNLFSGVSSKKEIRNLTTQVAALEDQVPAATEAATGAQREVQNLRVSLRDAFTNIQSEFSAIRSEMVAKPVKPEPKGDAATGSSDASASAPASPSGRTYTFREGDTLGRVASKNKITLKALTDANPGLDPRKIRVGQKINLP